MKCRDLSSTIIQVTAPATADTLFTVPHELGQTPRGAMIVRGNSPTAILYRPTTLSGGANAALNIVGAWEFEDTPPKAFEADSGPNGLTLTNTAVIQSDVSKIGTSGNFIPASAARFSRNSEANLQTGDIDFTFAGWVRFNSLATNLVFIGKRNNVAADNEYQIALLGAPTNRFFAQVYKAGSQVSLTANTFGLPSVNTWYFIVVWHDAAADTFNIQINDGGVDSVATGGPLQAPSTAQFRIGARGDPGNELYWNGQIDQVMFWKRTLTAGERTSLYNAGAGVSVADLTTLSMTTNFIAGWEFGDGLIGRDSSSNNLHLTCVGGAFTQPAGKPGNAVSLVSASSQYLLRASEPALQMGDIDFTLAAWVRFAGAVAANNIIGKDNNIAGQREYNLNYSTVSGAFQITAFSATDVQKFGPATAFGAASVGVWYLVIGWHDSVANTLNCQVNNSAVTSTPTGGALQAASTARFDIGDRQYSTSRIYWNGDIDQVMIWKRILTADERTALYNGGNGLTYAQAIPSPVNDLVPWDATNAYLKCNVANAQFYVMFFV